MQIFDQNVLFFFPYDSCTVCLPLCPAVYRSVEPGWLQATYEGKTGLIPENYVVFL